MENVEPKENKTPKWLRRLEKESWQAELLISGLALFGSLQLPKFVYALSDMLVDHLPYEQYSIGYILSYVCLLGVSILSSFFVIHLVLRAYWVGLIGLNSVFPDGYQIENELYSEHFTRRYIEKLPSVLTSIREIDEHCSTIFSSAFAFLMMYSSFAIIGIPYLFLYNYLVEFVPEWILLLPVGFFALVFVVVFIFSILNSIPKVKSNRTAQEIYVRSSLIFNYFNLLAVPTNQILMTSMTHWKKGKSSLLIPFFFLLMATVWTLEGLSESNIQTLASGQRDSGSFFREEMAYPHFYEKNNIDTRSITNPVIPDEEISGKFMRLFIPILKNESTLQDGFCATFEEDNNLTDAQNAAAEARAQLDCYVSYHRILVNDSVYNVEFTRHKHPRGNELGLLGYLPTKDFKLGKNNLRIEKLKNKGGDLFRKTDIPFWFTGE